MTYSLSWVWVVKWLIVNDYIRVWQLSFLILCKYMMFCASDQSMMTLFWIRCEYKMFCAYGCLELIYGPTIKLCDGNLSLAFDLLAWIYTLLLWCLNLDSWLCFVIHYIINKHEPYRGIRYCIFNNAHLTNTQDWSERDDSWGFRC